MGIGKEVQIENVARQEGKTFGEAFVEQTALHDCQALGLRVHLQYHVVHSRTQTGAVVEDVLDAGSLGGYCRSDAGGPEIGLVRPAEQRGEQNSGPLAQDGDIIATDPLDLSGDVLDDRWPSGVAYAVTPPALRTKQLGLASKR